MDRCVAFEEEVIVTLGGYCDIECNLLLAGSYLEVWHYEIVILNFQTERQRIQMDTPCHAFGNTEVGTAIQIDERSIHFEFASDFTVYRIFGT